MDIDFYIKIFKLYVILRAVDLRVELIVKNPRKRIQKIIRYLLYGKNRQFYKRIYNTNLTTLFNNLSKEIYFVLNCEKQTYWKSEIEPYEGMINEISNLFTVFIVDNP
jgi:hypothetical protein